MKKNRGKRLLASILAICVSATLFPMTAFADEGAGSSASVQASEGDSGSDSGSEPSGSLDANEGNAESESTEPSEGGESDSESTDATDGEEGDTGSEVPDAIENSADGDSTDEETATDTVTPTVPEGGEGDTVPETPGGEVILTPETPVVPEDGNVIPAPSTPVTSTPAPTTPPVVGAAPAAPALEDKLLTQLKELIEQAEILELPSEYEEELAKLYAEMLASLEANEFDADAVLAFQSRLKVLQETAAANQSTKFNVTYVLDFELEKLGYELNCNNQGQGSEYTKEYDGRITAFGVWVRKDKNQDMKVKMILLDDVEGTEQKHPDQAQRFRTGTILSSADKDKPTVVRVKMNQPSGKNPPYRDRNEDGYSDDGYGFGFTRFAGGTEMRIMVTLQAEESNSLELKQIVRGVNKLPDDYAVTVTLKNNDTNSEWQEKLDKFVWDEEEDEWVATAPSTEDLVDGMYSIVKIDAPEIPGYTFSDAYTGAAEVNHEINYNNTLTSTRTYMPDVPAVHTGSLTLQHHISGVAKLPEGFHVDLTLQKNDAETTHQTLTLNTWSKDEETGDWVGVVTLNDLEVGSYTVTAATAAELEGYTLSNEVLVRTVDVTENADESSIAVTSYVYMVQDDENEGGNTEGGGPEGGGTEGGNTEGGNTEGGGPEGGDTEGGNTEGGGPEGGDTEGGNTEGGGPEGGNTEGGGSSGGSSGGSTGGASNQNNNRDNGTSNTVVIPDGLVPMAQAPETTAAEVKPSADQNSVVTILDDVVPLGNLPTTGSHTRRLMQGGLGLLMTGVALFLTDRKKKK